MIGLLCLIAYVPSYIPPLLSYTKLSASVSQLLLLSEAVGQPDTDLARPGRGAPRQKGEEPQKEGHHPAAAAA